MMIDCALHLTRPPPIPVVFDRIQNLPAVAVKELRRNELPRVILHRDVPPPLAIMGVTNDWRILTTRFLNDWGIWKILILIG